MPRYKVVLAGQVFPTVEVERPLLAGINAELIVAEGDRAQILRSAHDADGILTASFSWDADAIAQLTRCRIIAGYGTGYDKVDLDAARTAGITVTNVPDYAVEEVAAHSLALILALLRRIPQADQYLRAGGWFINPLRPVHRISQLTAGLIGYGRIARRLSKSLQVLGMSVAAYDPYLDPTPGAPPLLDLDDLLRTSDVISVHTPLTPETRGLLGSKEFGLMKETAILINTSRGPIVDQCALLRSLSNRELGGAALDVFEQEPPDVTQFRDVPNLILTPHIAYYSEDAIAESQQKAVHQVIKTLTGQEPAYRIN